MFIFEASSNNYWWIELLGIFLSSLLAFAIARYMFYREVKKKETEEQERLSELKEYLFQSIKYLYWGIESQILALESFKANEEVLPTQLILDVGIIPDNITKVSNDDLFKIFVLRSNLKLKEKDSLIACYQRFVGSFIILNYIKNSLHENSTREINEYEFYSKEILNITSKIKEIARNEIPDDERWLQNKLNTDEVFEFLFTTIKNSSIETTTIEHMMNSFIIPLFNFCIVRNNNPIAKQSNLLCSQALGYSQKLESSKTISNELFEKSIETFRKIQITIIELISFTFPDRVKEFKTKPDKF